MKEYSIDIVITSFNGRQLLEKHLPTVIKNSPKVNNIIVVDDASSDDTGEFLKKNYPQITYIRNSKNQGFPMTSNTGVAASNSDLVVLLNNDVSPQKDYLKTSVKFFSDPKVFAVTFNEENSSWPEVTWRDGKLHYTRGQDRSTPRYSAWFSGGSSIVRKSTWQQLSGFNEIYSPGYWEDIDLGWRAWKAGNKIIWDPTSLVDHQHESTFKKLKPSFINLVKQRNELFFIWQNITDRHLAKSHYFFLLKYTINHFGYLRIILSAIRHYPLLIKNRIQNRKNSKIKDSQVLELINQPV